MLISVVIESAEDGKTLRVESSGSGKVKVAIGAGEVIVGGMLVDQGITNALNIGIDIPVGYSVQTTVADVETKKSLVLENHDSDRTLIVVRIGGDLRNVNGREFSTAVRQCTIHA